VTGGMTSQDDGTKKLVAGAVFPIGLIVVLVAGGELFTGNTAIMIPSLLSRRITIGDVARSVMRLAGGFMLRHIEQFLLFLHLPYSQLSSRYHIRSCTYEKQHKHLMKLQQYPITYNSSKAPTHVAKYRTIRALREEFTARA